MSFSVAKYGDLVVKKLEVHIYQDSLKFVRESVLIYEIIIVLKCKIIFYISVDISFVSSYNKSEEMEGGHHNEV